MQSDIKRMLVYSSMGQMGFMIMQCGLGLFPAAVAHLLWHGLFVAFLFLRAGSILQERWRQSYVSMLNASSEPCKNNH